MFKITFEPIIGETPKPPSNAGAVVVFEGRVRDLNEGLKVDALEYEAFQPLAEKEGQKIVDEALQRFGLVGLSCVHPVGKLELGDVAIQVVACGVHRGEAFAGCEYVVEQVKARVPIWKKEHYTGGDAGWINADDSLDERREAMYYSRQTLLKEVDQAKLKSARVLVVGAGGLGSPALSYLAAAGVGTIGVCDFDNVELSNLHRQILFAAEDCGKPKASVAARCLGDLNPFIEVHPHCVRLDRENAAELMVDYDLVLDCTDNFETKFLLSDLAVELQKPLVVASIYQFEGQILTIAGESGCLRCLWPATPHSGCVGSCAEVGVLGTVPGVLGSLQAMEALKLILGLSTDAARDNLVVVDLLELTVRRIKRSKNPNCPVCGDGVVEENMSISALSEEFLSSVQVIDIRESHERPELPIEHVRLPMSRFDAQAVRGPTLLVCAHGARSAMLAESLRENGFLEVYSLEGGLPALEAFVR